MVGHRICIELISASDSFMKPSTNTIAVTAKAAWGWDEHAVGVALVIMTAPIIFGGIRRVPALPKCLSVDGDFVSADGALHHHHKHQPDSPTSSVRFLTARSTLKQPAAACSAA